MMAQALGPRTRQVNAHGVTFPAFLPLDRPVRCVAFSDLSGEAVAVHRLFYAAGTFAFACLAAAVPARAGELIDLMAGIEAHTHAGNGHIEEWQRLAQQGDVEGSCVELENARVELETAFHDVEAVRGLVENGGDLEGNDAQDVLDFVTQQEEVASETGGKMADYYNAYCQ